MKYRKNLTHRLTTSTATQYLLGTVGALVLGGAISMNAYAIGGVDNNGNNNYTVDNDVTPTHKNVGRYVILAQAPNNSITYFDCTATLIEPNLALTAGHCSSSSTGIPLFAPNLTYFKSAVTFNADAQDVLNASGTDLNPALEWHETSYDITARNLNILPNFFALSQTDSNDVGVLVLKEPIPSAAEGGIDPAKIPALTTPPLLEDSSVYPPPGPNHVILRAVGYGVIQTGTATNGSGMPIYGDAGLRRYGDTTIENVTNGHINTTENTVDGEITTCFGDSGGPILAQNPVTGEDLLIGVVSSGSPGQDIVGVCRGARTFYPRMDTSAGQLVVNCVKDKLANGGNPCDCDWLENGLIPGVNLCSAIFPN